MPEPTPTGPQDPIASDAQRNAPRTRAERIPLRALEKRGFRNVQVLDMATIEKIVGEAVTHLLERHTAVMSGDDRARIESEARAEFAKLLAEHKKVVAEKSAEERRREELERQMQGLRAELARQHGDLAAEKERTSGEFSLSPASFKEMEEKIRGLFARLVSEERRMSLADAGPGALKGLSALEAEVAALLDRLLQGERDRFMGTVRKGHSEKVDVLEKRIAKLNRALHDTEDALRRMAEAKAGDPGIASIYDTVQGLSAGDAFFAKKKELLAVIFEENLALQRKAAGASAPAPAPEAKPASPLSWAIPASLGGAGALKTAAELGFEAPLDPVTDETAF